MEPEIKEATEEQLRQDVAATIFEGKAPTIEVADEHIEEEAPIEEEDLSQEIEEEKKLEADPLAGVNPALLEKLNSIADKLSIIDKLDYRVKQTESRVGAISNAADKAKKEVKPAPTQEEIAAAAEKKKFLDDFKEDYADFEKAVDIKVGDALGEKPDISGLKEGIEKVKEAQSGMITAQDVQISLVDFHQPDWREKRITPEYQNWIVTQSSDIQRMHTSGKTAKEAIYVLNKFDEDQASKKTTDNNASTSQQRLESAVTTNKSRKGPIVKSEANMTEEEVRQAEAAKLWPD